MSKKKATKSKSKVVEQTYEELVAKHDELWGIGPKSEAASKRIFDLIRKECSENEINPAALLGLVYDRFNCATLDLEWTLEKYWANQVRKFIPDLERIYVKLVENGQTEEACHEFNDLDDHVWYIPLTSDDNRRIFVHTSQNLNLIFVWDKSSVDNRYGKVHIRRYWDKFEIKDKWDEQEDQGFKDAVAKHGRLAMLKEMNMDRFADDVLDKSYPTKPSFDYFKKNNFKFRYEDGRDLGYVLTYSRLDNKVDWALSHHGILKIVFECYIPSIISSLFDEEN